MVVQKFVSTVSVTVQAGQSAMESAQNDHAAMVHSVLKCLGR